VGGIAFTALSFKGKEGDGANSKGFSSGDRHGWNKKCCTKTGGKRRAIGREGWTKSKTEVEKERIIETAEIPHKVPSQVTRGIIKSG